LIILKAALYIYFRALNAEPVCRLCQLIRCQHRRRKVS